MSRDRCAKRPLSFVSTESLSEACLSVQVPCTGTWQLVSIGAKTAAVSCMHVQVFAMVTSLQMVGSTISGTISAQLTLALGVTLTDYSNLPLLTIITASLKLTALPFVVLAPKHISEASSAGQEPTSDGGERSSSHDKSVSAPAAAVEGASSSDQASDPLLPKATAAAAASSWWGAFWLAFCLSAGIVWSITNAIWRLVEADTAGA